MIRQIISDEQAKTSIFGEDSESLPSLPQISDDFVLKGNPVIYHEVKTAFKKIGAENFHVENVEAKNMPALITVEQNEESKKFIAIRKAFMTLIDGNTMQV